MYEQLKLDNQICFRLYTASRLMTQAYRPMLEPLGLSYPKYLVLLVLWEKDNMVVGDICRRLSLDTGTLTPLLQRMEADGLIVRTRGIADGRQTLVSLTRKGATLQEDCKDIPSCMIQRCSDTMLNAEQASQMVESLDALINVLKQH